MVKSVEEVHIWTISSPGLVLWDIDNTLVSTTDYDRHAYRTVVKRLTGRDAAALPPSGAGRSEHATLRELLRANGVTGTDFDRLLPDATALLRRLLTRDPAGMRAAGRVLPGAPEAMEAVARLTGAVGVATGNLREVARAKLRAFGLDHLVDWRLSGCAEDGATKTQLVRHVQRNAARLGLGSFSRRTTVLIGDARTDAAAGGDGAAAVLGVTTGRTDREALKAAGADLVLADLSDTAAVVAAVRRLLTASGQHPSERPSGLPA